MEEIKKSIKKRQRGVPVRLEFSKKCHKSIRKFLVNLSCGMNLSVSWDDFLVGKATCLPFWSAVIDDCIAKGQDVTQGGAHYNFAGVQAIQVANVADSLAAIRELVYDKKILSAERLLHALQTDFQEDELCRVMLLNKAPKYGNDVEWVDRLGTKWADYFAERLKQYRNGRGGIYQMGLYTVSAHVPCLLYTSRCV